MKMGIQEHQLAKAMFNEATANLLDEGLQQGRRKRDSSREVHQVQRNPERNGGAGYRPNTIFGIWSTVVVVGIIAAGAGKAFIGASGSLAAIFAQALAGGAVLALVSHAMIPEAIHGGGSLTVLPIVAGFLFALYLALSANLV
jgi:DNA-binding transcriptional LysR family regulator